MVLTRYDKTITILLLALATCFRSSTAFGQSTAELDKCIDLLKLYNVEQNKKDEKDRGKFTKEELRAVLFCIDLSEKTKDKPPQTIFKQSK